MRELTPVREAIVAARRRLQAMGVPSPQVDARLLAAHVLDVEPAGLADQRFTAQQAQRFEQLVAQREKRVPLQHLTGVAYFRYLSVAVGPGVFIPRPETEVVAGAAIAEATRLAGQGNEPVVVDLATGSGAIALALATEVPQARVFAVELDTQAFTWAQRNLAAHPEVKIELQQADLAFAFPQLAGQVDVVVSNPPYIPVDAVVRDVEVAQHDPALALWSGADGLDAMRGVQASAARLLRSGGLVVAEHADVQGESAPAVFTATGLWHSVSDHLDLAERPRYLTARRAG